MKKKIEAPFIRNPYNYDTNEASDQSGLLCLDPHLAQQQFKDDSDINVIVERYGLTGELPEVLNLPTYGDFTGIFDFQTAQNAIVQAQRDFMTLPAKLRARFNNDPQMLMDFLADDSNRKEAEFLGLLNPPQDAPQSSQGAPGGKPKGDLPPPDDKPTGDAPPKTSKKDKTDT